MSTPIDALMQSVAWTPTCAEPDDDGLPHATHSGVLEFAGLRLRCHRLSDGRTVFDADDFRAAFGDLLGEQTR